MAKSKQTFQKNEKEKKKKQKQKEKEEKRAQRKAESAKGKGFDSMIAYVDHNGQLSNTPPDPNKKVEIKAEDILLGARSFENNDTDRVKTGRIAIFNSDRNFGFIKDDISHEKIFFHISSCNYDVKEGDMVSYEVAYGAKGPNAVNIDKQGAA
jgi:cold shock CspA family protein